MREARIDTCGLTNTQGVEVGKACRSGDNLNLNEKILLATVREVLSKCERHSGLATNDLVGATHCKVAIGGARAFNCSIINFLERELKNTTCIACAHCGLEVEHEARNFGSGDLSEIFFRINHVTISSLRVAISTLYREIVVGCFTISNHDLIGT